MSAGKQALSEDISEVLPLVGKYSSQSVYIKRHLILLKRLIPAADKILTNS